MSNAPEFPIETRNRLCVQTKIHEEPGWSEPRAATFEELLAMLGELGGGHRERAIEVLGASQKALLKRLRRAERTLRSLRDASADLDMYRAEYPTDVDDDDEIPF